MSVWSEFYKNRVGESYLAYAASRYKPMIDLLVSEGSSFLEVGCGIGTISKALMRQRPDISVQLLDNDPDILNLASKNMAGLSCELFHSDILRCQDSAEVIFSHGVLEHFTDREINRILDQQRVSSNIVVHYIPTDGYSKPSFGDERLLPYRYWLVNFSPSDYILFNDNKDLLLIWKGV